MKDQLTSKVEDLALLLVMLHDGDSQGLELVLASCTEVAQLAADSSEFERLTLAFNSAIQLANSDSDQPIVPLLNQLVETTQQFLAGDITVSFPNESDQNESDQNISSEELSPDLDSELLVDFIETHTGKLAEFESTLLQAAAGEQMVVSSEGEEQSIASYTKSYLHNIKGDAGTVGLIGIERVTHAVEDLLIKCEVENLIDLLIKYKEWACECMNAFAEGTEAKVPSGQFLNSLDQGQEDPSPTENKCSPDTQMDSKACDTYQLTGEAEILYEFITEAEDHLQQVEETLLDAQGSYTGETVNSVFRAVHSIKGGSSYFSLEETQNTSHTLENILSKARDGAVVFDGYLAELVLEYIDLQKVLFQNAAEASRSGSTMLRLSESEIFLHKLQEYWRSIDTAPTTAASTVELSSPTATLELADAAPLLTEPENDNASETIPSQQSTTPREITSKRAGEKLAVKSFLKVDTRKLDTLIDYIGEMVTSSSMLIRNCRDYLPQHETVMNNTRQLEQISRELHEIGMSMRLIPIKGLFQKMARLVWDTSKKIGKDINFRMEGEDTELDKGLVDKIADPLMHMVRNAIDHGIESPAEREATEKPVTGQVTLSAFHSGGSIHIQITDDGRGLDPEKLLQKAVEKGIVTEGQQLSEQETYHLIFAAGLSTAKQVTDISGRGVGMDVVRRNIEALRGRIHISSEVGKGTTFTIELPLTLAIIDGIETQVGPECFIIPTLSIVEFLKPHPGLVATTFEKGEMISFREMFLPLYRLSELYGINPLYQDPSDGLIVIVEGQGRLVALLVDNVVGKYSTVIKSLGKKFEDVKGLAGCAILPNGEVGLILDVISLIELARKHESLNAERQFNDHSQLESTELLH